MRYGKIGILALLPALALGILACGGGKEEPAAAGSVEKAEPPKVEKQAETTPEEIGGKIGSIYEQAMTEMTGLLKDKPEAFSVRDRLSEMREKYIQELVKLGHLREALDEAGRAAVDRRIVGALEASYRQPFFTAFNEIQQHYFGDQDFHKIVMSFNIITQYASFDLLKKQAPAEALRLGIQ